MKKAALAVISLVVLLSILVFSQFYSSASANPNWRPWENQPQIKYPVIDVVSPIEGGNYSSSDVWLKFTITKPYWLNITNYQIRFVSYSLDTQIVDSRYEERVDVEDPLGVVDAPSSFNFSINLTGLEDGVHTVMFDVDGVDGENEFTIGMPTIGFTVYTAKPEFPLAILIVSEITVGVVLFVGLGLLVYIIKRNGPLKQIQGTQRNC